MKSETYRKDVRLPSREEFAQDYPQYGPKVRADGSDLFDLVMRPDSFVRAMVVTEALGLPAVSGIANECAAARRGTIADTGKQLVGALTCALMTRNGFRKKGQKRSIPQRGWSRGEVYERVK